MNDKFNGIDFNQNNRALRRALVAVLSAWDIQVVQEFNEFAEWIIYLVRHRIRTYVEIGSFAGGTFSFAVEALSKLGTFREAWSVDPYPLDTLTSYVRRKRSSNVNILKRRSDDLSVTALVERLRPDAIFIDASHEYFDTRFEASLALRTANCLIGFHDVNYTNFDVIKVWNDVKALRPGSFRQFQYTCKEISNSDGSLGLFQCGADWIVGAPGIGVIVLNEPSKM